MSKATFTSVKKIIKGGLLNAGKHLVAITSIVDAKAKETENKAWSDLTPQLEVTMKNDEGTIKRWFNMQGYKNLEDFPNGKAPAGFKFVSSKGGEENYLVDKKTNERVISDEKTEKAVKIFCEFACDAGVEEGEDFSIEDLIDVELGVCVRDTKGSVEVHYTMPASRIEVSEEAD